MVNCKKLLAMFLIFTLTFSNFAYATNGFISLFGIGKRNGNVEFEAYFVSGEEQSTALASNVNNKDLSIKMQLEVKEKGYLKDGEIKIVEGDGEDLNFKIRTESESEELLEDSVQKEEIQEIEDVISEEIEVSENEISEEKEEADEIEDEISEEEESKKISSENEKIAEIEDSENRIHEISDNTISLRKIESSSGKVEISIPIEYYQEKYINESKLKATSKITLTGKYVDDDGDENEISEEVNLTLAWKDEREAKVDTDVTKFIKFGEDGVILQTKVTVDSRTDKNTLPIKSTELKIDVPTIDENIPTEVTVLANSTEGTNGKGVGEVEFDKTNWSYNENDKKITINVDNKKELVKVNEVNENEEYLKEDKEEKEEERYFSGSGEDEFLITYVYKNIKVEDEIAVSTKTNAKISIFSGVDNEENEVVISNEAEKEFTLSGQTGNIVSYDVENKTKNISKIYGYLGNEKEIETKTSINVSLTDLVEEIKIEDLENYYIDKSENSVVADDIYYKEISVSKDNFEDILGKEGKIEILNKDENVLATINKDMEANENGNYVVNFEEKTSKIIIKTSAPENKGNLIITSKKVIENANIDKNAYAQIKEFATDTNLNAKLEYVSELAELDKNTVKTVLDDTKTNFNLIIDRNSLSTVTTNSDVEMRLEFNNDEELSDIYGSSIFEVEMPEYITNVEVTNAETVNGEGLELSNIETYEKNGKIIIKMTVDGEQKALNSGVLTNGTNIVINMNIDVDNYTPAKDDVITVYGYNSKATNYENESNYTINDVTTTGISELDIAYSGPSGVVAINSLSDYSEEGKMITSVKEGSKTDFLEIYGPARNAKSEIVLINNNENEVSNVSILGRLPFKGVKDIDSENELGTTIDTPLAGLVTANEKNNGEFTVYYSDNKEATRSLDNDENNWITEPESLENVKSFLIVPSNEEYTLKSKEVLRFSYDFAIPENMEHNEKVVGTFMAYYDNQGIEESSRPDLVALSTGAGPELGLEVKADKEKVKALDEFTITAKLKNTGEELASDVNLVIPVPAGTTYISANSDRDSAQITFENNEVVANMVRLEKDASIELVATFRVDEIETEEANDIEISAKARAKNLRKEKVVEGKAVKVLSSELILGQYMNFAYPNATFSKNYQLDFVIYAKNVSDKDKENVKVTTQLPEELEFIDAYMIENFYDYFASAQDKKQVNNATYDSNTNKVTWDLGKLEANKKERLILSVKVKEIDNGISNKNVVVASHISADNTDTYNAKDMSVKIGRDNLKVTQSSSTPTYVTEGDDIDYTFTIKNEGGISSGNVSLVDIIPEGLVVKEISYGSGENAIKSNVSLTDIATATVSVPANQEVQIDVKARALSLDGAKEQTVTNEGKITYSNGETIESNSVTHIIQAKEDTTTNSNSNNNNSNNTNNTPATQTEITKSYKITGIAWLDANKNGMRDADEKKMSNIKALLVESETGIIKATTTTNNNGEYSFGGLRNGSYLVIFKYDTKLYTTTVYRKEGVDTSANSDVVTTKIEQEGKTEYAGVTDTITIADSNVTEVDIGLVDSTKFSLALDKSITKITVQNEQGTKTQKYNKSKLAKYEIRAKYLTGSTVYVEYTFTIKNNGDLAGYASEIVDYIPEGMTFNSSLNKDWYTGTDGNLHTKALENTELNIGESKELTLVLTKQMTEENTGIVSNTAEIASDFNIYGVADDNSTPANKAQNEDDMSTADVIISVGTGEVLIYISAIIVSLLLASGIGIITYKRLEEKKRKGGV